MVEFRESWWERFRWVPFAVAVMALGAGVAWLRMVDPSRATVCRQAYAAAKTAADSARVDDWVPLVNRSDAMDQQSCLVIRRAGRP
jgi:hypothetical protein